MIDYLEIREKRDGTWLVFYPDEAFIPCAPVCTLKHSHEYDGKLVQSYYKPTDLQDAKDWAKSIAFGRQIKIIKYEVKGNEKAKVAKA